MNKDNVSLLIIFLVMGFCIGTSLGILYTTQYDEQVIETDVVHVYTEQYNTHEISIGDYVVIDTEIQFSDLNETEQLWCVEFMAACAGGELFDFEHNPAPSSASQEFVIQQLESLGY